MTSSVSAKPASEEEHGTSRAEKKVAIVTGASQGIGAGIAAAFTAAGYAVVGTALSVEPSATPDVLMVPGDIAQAETAELVVQQGLDRFGRIDTLVNNAGIYIGKPFTDYTVDDYVAITSVNLTGFFHMTQRTIAQMVAQGGGHVVNVSTSLVEHADAREPSALTSLTKGGLEAVTRSLATEYAGRGIRVNAVALGIIETPLHDPASYRELAKRHPLGRVGEVSDVVDGVLYLERATFVTGATLRIDGAGRPEANQDLRTANAGLQKCAIRFRARVGVSRTNAAAVLVADPPNRTARRRSSDRLWTSRVRWRSLGGVATPVVGPRLTGCQRV